MDHLQYSSVKHCILLSQTTPLALLPMGILGLGLSVTVATLPTDAARQGGFQAYKRMQTILSDGVKSEVEKGMFEKAQENMRYHFQELKVSCAPLVPWRPLYRCGQCLGVEGNVPSKDLANACVVM